MPASAHDRVTLVSAKADGTPGNSPSTFGLSITADGGTIAFASAARNLVEADADRAVDDYAKRVDAGKLTLVSTSSTGTKASALSLRPVIDGTGRRVAFLSAADDLDPQDTDGFPDVFVKDLVTGRLTLVTSGPEGRKANAGSGAVDLSADGRRVAFTTSANSLLPEDADSAVDVYVKDLESGPLWLTSRNAEGTRAPIGNVGTGQPQLSADGSRVASTRTRRWWLRTRTNAPDIYLKDLTTGERVLGSVSRDEFNSPRGSHRPSMSADGYIVAFDSFLGDLTPEDTSGDNDVNVKDLRTGSLAVAASSAAGVKANGRSTAASVSGDGTRVAFSSDAGLTPLALPGTLHTYVKDLVTGM